MRAGQRYLDRHDPSELLSQVGRRLDQIPRFRAIDKSALPDSYGGRQPGPSNDFLAGRGLFYISEQRRLYLDCTSGHYQMLWGYHHPALCRAVEAASHTGVIWDNHSNIPQSPLKWLAHRLVALGNAPGEPDPLDTVLLGVCTGSVACAAALKIQLKVFERERSRRRVPLVVVLEGNYHGTDMVPQFMRGLWPGLARPFDVLTLPPNEPTALERAFRKHGSRIAGFWAEPILMNREAIALEPDYLHLVQHWCRHTGALFCVDEIQTGFWQPEIFAYRALGLRPDLVVLGKGMTAGFHPLAGVLLHHRHDVLEQYDAISTNGSAALPALVALCSLELIQAQGERIRQVGERIHRGFQELAAAFPGPLETAHGAAHLTGLKFRQVDQARQFHQRLLEAGLWTRVHAYHEGHRTILTKLGLLADEPIVDFLHAQFRRLLLRHTSGRRRP
jgi:acetylornithine/succinyldiaminopimelate/putrescine aminotransferase